MIKKPLQHTSSIAFTYNWIGSLFLFVCSAQGACETRAFSFVSRRKHLLEREGLLKNYTTVYPCLSEPLWPQAL